MVYDSYGAVHLQGTHREQAGYHRGCKDHSQSYHKQYSSYWAHGTTRAYKAKDTMPTILRIKDAYSWRFNMAYHSL